jgi:hypothetical protein
MVFVDAADSPNGNPLVIIGNEISGTVVCGKLSKTSFELFKILETNQASNK